MASRLATLAFFLALIVNLAFAHDGEDHGGAQACDNSNQNFTEAFYGEEIFHDGHHHDELPVFSVVSCNHSHFTVSVDGVHETHELSVYTYSECAADDHDHDARLLSFLYRDLHGNETEVDPSGQCYYAFCSTIADLEGNSNHTHAERRRRRVLHEGHNHSEGEGEGEEPEEELFLVTAHVEYCCDYVNDTMKAVPHHYCLVEDFFSALQEGETEPTESPTAESDKTNDVTIFAAIGGVAAFAILLAGLAYVSPASEAETGTELKPQTENKNDKVLEVKIAEEVQATKEV